MPRHPAPVPRNVRRLALTHWHFPSPERVSNHQIRNLLFYLTITTRNDEVRGVGWTNGWGSNLRVTIATRTLGLTTKKVRAGGEPQISSSPPTDGEVQSLFGHYFSRVTNEELSVFASHRCIQVEANRRRSSRVRQEWRVRRSNMRWCSYANTSPGFFLYISDHHAECMSSSVVTGLESLNSTS